jgi:iron complex transport system ATP-binding protein
LSTFQADSLDFSYGDKPVLRGCSLRVEEGEFAALAGPNGAGKSTLFSLLTGCRTPSAGTITFLGRKLSEWSPRELARRLAILPQSDLVPPGMTAFELVLLGRAPFLSGFFRFEGQDDRRLAMDCLERVDVAPLAQRQVATLSGGERRLVMIARALAQQPTALLLDEPASSLDLHHQQAIFRLLKRLNQEEKLTILTVTHDLNVASLYCSRLMLMSEGRIAAEGAPADLIREEVLRPIYHAELWTGRRPDGGVAVGLLP